MGGGFRHGLVVSGKAMGWSLQVPRNDRAKRGAAMNAVETVEPDTPMGIDVIVRRQVGRR